MGYSVSRGSEALDNRVKAKDGQDKDNGSQAPKNNDELLKQVLKEGKKLSGADRKKDVKDDGLLADASAKPSSAYSNALQNLSTYGMPSLTVDGSDQSSSEGRSVGESYRQRVADRNEPVKFKSPEEEKKWDGGKIEIPGLGKDKPSDANASAEEKDVIRFFKPVEIKIAGILNGSIPAGSSDVEAARKQFLDDFKKHHASESQIRKADRYIKHMIRENHDLKAYGEAKHEKVAYISDKKIVACMKEWSKVCTTKRTGDAANWSDGKVNKHLLGQIGFISRPDIMGDQGQIGSCGLHAGLTYLIKRTPEEVAKNDRKVLTRGEFRGKMTKFDMGPANGQNSDNHRLVTELLRCVYKQKHLDGGYGGTDTDSLNKGIKRYSHGKTHGVWNDGATVRNGADLDITMGGAHCQASLISAERQGDYIVLKEEQDNSWGRYSDGRKRVIGKVLAPKTATG